MPRSLYSTWCLVLTLIYVVIAIYVIWDDRTHTGGGWISLNGMTSFLVTLPISAFVNELLGYRLDFRRNIDMAFAVLGTATCVYFALFGIGTLLHTMFSSHVIPTPPTEPRP